MIDDRRGVVIAQDKGRGPIAGGRVYVAVRVVIGILLWYNPINDTLDAVSSPAERREVQQIMAQLADYTLVKLPGSLVTEIQGVQPGANLDSFVRQAVHAYIAAGRRRELQQQLVKDYDALAAMYSEVAAELSDEVWLPVENAALLQTEKGLAA